MTPVTTAPAPAYRVLQRALLAAALLAAPLVMASWFALCPEYGNPGCPDTSNPLGNLVAYRAAGPILLTSYALE